MDDKQLLILYIEGDESALTRLVERYQKELYGFVFRQVGNQADAADLTQKVFVNVFLKAEQFNGDSSFKTWLYQIARNRLVDHYRRQNIRLVDSNPGPLSSLSDAEQQRPENRLESSDRHQLLLDAIASLPQEQKEVFLLKEEAGLAIEEIALTTGVTYEAAKSRLRYAVKKLKAQLEKVYEH